MVFQCDFNRVAAAGVSLTRSDILVGCRGGGYRGRKGSGLVVCGGCDLMQSQRRHQISLTHATVVVEITDNGSNFLTNPPSDAIVDEPVIINNHVCLFASCQSLEGRWLKCMFDQSHRIRH